MVFKLKKEEKKKKPSHIEKLLGQRFIGKAGYKPTAPESMKRKMIEINPSSWIQPMDKDRSRFFKEEWNKQTGDLYK